MTTIYLDPESWDLALDANRNIALAADPYATAQSVANAARLWSGEAPFNTDRGMPYESQILGKQVPERILAAWYQREAESVPNVQSATAVLQFDRATRKLGGQIQVTLNDGTIVNVQ